MTEIYKNSLHECLPRALLHGSNKITDNTRLSSRYGKEGDPFGPALYMTPHPNVARANAYNEGRIYVIELHGNPHLTLPMNFAWKDISVDARIIIQKLLKIAEISISADATSIWRILQHAGKVLGEDKLNELLAEFGIWMLYGTIDGLESGMCDKGVQYALISDAAIVQRRYWDFERDS